MRRHEFDHVIAAAADICGEREIVVIGSQAILGTVADPPARMLFSMEADVYPRNNPRKAELVRLEIPARVGQSENAIAFCLEIHDLVLAKCVAARERDWEFAQDAVAANLVQVDELFRRVEDLPEPPADRAHVKRMLEGIVARVDQDPAR